MYRSNTAKVLRKYRSNTLEVPLVEYSKSTTLGTSVQVKSTAQILINSSEPLSIYHAHAALHQHTLINVQACNNKRLKLNRKWRKSTTVWTLFCNSWLSPGGWQARTVRDRSLYYATQPQIWTGSQLTSCGSVTEPSQARAVVLVFAWSL